MTLKKEHLVRTIQNHLDLPKARSVELVESVLETIKTTLVNGEDVLLSGFGKFYVKSKGERRGRNPQTGDRMMLDSRRVVTFKCSPVLRDEINGL